MRISCWIINATKTHSEYVAFIAFPLQQRIKERLSKLHYTPFPVLLSYLENRITWDTPQWVQNQRKVSALGSIRSIFVSTCDIRL